MSLRKRIGQSSFESAAQEAVVSLLVVAGEVQQALSDVCGRHGITHDQYNVLRILRGVHPAGHPRYEISQRLISRAPDVTRLLDRLERQGLVERVRSEDDRRLSISRIAGAGLEVLRNLDPEIHEIHRRFTTGLSEVECRKLVRLCGEMLR